jgi:hypothetical protein
MGIFEAMSFDPEFRALEGRAVRVGLSATSRDS